MASIIKRIDHFVFLSNRSEELLRTLTETFQLPLIWPLSDFGGYVSGGASARNAALEVGKVGAADKPAFAELSGIVFEPAPLNESILELDARKIEHTAPEPYAGVAPSAPGIAPNLPTGTRLWTAMGIKGMETGGFVAVCDYNWDVIKRAGEFEPELRARDGGPLGIESIREIILGTSNLNQAIARWQNLLNPLQPSAEGYWEFESGPALRLVESERNHMQRLVFTANSLDKAKEFLSRSAMLGSLSAHEIAIAPESLQGLDIRLVE